MFFIGRVMGEDVFFSFVIIYEVNSFDGRFVEDKVDSFVGVVNDVYDIFGVVSFDIEFGKDYGGIGVVFGGFDDEGVVGDGGDRDRLERNYSREVCVFVLVVIGIYWIVVGENLLKG